MVMIQDKFVRVALIFLAAVAAAGMGASAFAGTPAEEESAALAQINLRRNQLGLPSLTFNARLQTAARGHANYLVTNNLTGHFQDKDQFSLGFTGDSPSDRVQAAAYDPASRTGEIISTGPTRGVDAIEALIQAIYHRMGIFATDYNEQGAGVNVKVGGKQSTVVNFGNLNFPPAAAPAGWVGVYPLSGQTGVTADFLSDEESPDPVPNQNRVGYPVSFHIGDGRKLVVTSFTLAPAGGTPVPVLLLAPSSTDMPGSAASIIPLSVLAYATTYEASFTGTADGVAVTKTWQFTTAPALAISGPAIAYVGDTVTVNFTGGSRSSIRTQYSSTAQVSQDGLSGLDSFSFRADGPGDFTLTVTDRDTSKVIAIAIKSADQKPAVTATGPVTLSFVPGFSLVGNGSGGAITVADLFGDQTKTVTVWKWLAATSKWAFYAPSLAGQALSDFAASKGYDVLTTINPGEGFWVNAKIAFNAQLPAGTPVSSASFQSLATGFNLIATGGNKTPSQFNVALSTTPLATGIVPLNIVTLWAWDATLGSWYFYAPSLEAKGGAALTGFITGKGYLDFTARSKLLTPGVGFWVNK